MALFIDAVSPTVEDLLAYDRNLLDVAGTESLNSSEKLEIARSQVGSSLQAFLRGEGYSATLDNIVLDEILVRWIAYTALSLFYRDAHYHQLNDRYRAKWQEYDGLAREMRRSAIEDGVGLLSNPLPRPAKPLVFPVSGSLAAGGYFVSISCAGPDNTESELSELSSILLSPNGAVEVPRPALGEYATGWNVYAGTSEDALTRQNSNTLGLVDISFRIDTAVGMGALPGRGQRPERVARHRNVLRRG